MITGGFGVSVLLGDDGHPRARHWHVRADGVKRWADNDQPCEQPGGDGMPLCAVGGGGACCTAILVRWVAFACQVGAAKKSAPAANTANTSGSTNNGRREAGRA